MRFKNALQKVFLVASTIALLALPATALAQDTNAPPQPNLFDFLTTGSNYWVAPFATYAPSSGDFGGGVAIGYRVSDVVNPVLRVDDFAHQLWVVSGNIELQLPRSLLGKFPITPFALGGVATSFGGNGSQNGAICGVVGGGVYFNWSTFGTNSWLLRHAFTAVDYERWFNLPAAQQNQIRFAPINLHF